MRRIVVVGLIGGAVVVTAVAVSRRKAPVVVADGVPEWPPLRLVEPPTESTPDRATAVTAAAADEAAGTKWVAADASGGCPDTHPIKGKRSSRIFHVPGGAFYAQTKADRCFCDEDAAEADGYRKSKR
jgi:hypothetical protein